MFLVFESRDHAPHYLIATLNFRVCRHCSHRPEASSRIDARFPVVPLGRRHDPDDLSQAWEWVPKVVVYHLFLWLRLIDCVLDTHAETSLHPNLFAITGLLLRHWEYQNPETMQQDALCCRQSSLSRNQSTHLIRSCFRKEFEGIKCEPPSGLLSTTDEIVKRESRFHDLCNDYHGAASRKKTKQSSSSRK